MASKRRACRPGIIFRRTIVKFTTGWFPTERRSGFWLGRLFGELSVQGRPIRLCAAKGLRQRSAQAIVHGKLVHCFWLNLAPLLLLKSTAHLTLHLEICLSGLIFFGLPLLVVPCRTVSAAERDAHGNLVRRSLRWCGYAWGERRRRRSYTPHCAGRREAR